MRAKVGVFRYAVEIVDAAGEQAVELEPIVDTGAIYSQFPASVLRRLGYQPTGVRRFRLADGALVEREIGFAFIRIRGETQPTICIFGAEGSEQLLGAVTMEEFSLAPDPVNETLTPVVGTLLGLAGDLSDSVKEFALAGDLSDAVREFAPLSRRASRPTAGSPGPVGPPARLRSASRRPWA
jgi:predicted aspartyl protease